MEYPPAAATMGCGFYPCSRRYVSPHYMNLISKNKLSKLHQIVARLGVCQ